MFCFRWCHWCCCYCRVDFRFRSLSLLFWLKKFNYTQINKISWREETKRTTEKLWTIWKGNESRLKIKAKRKEKRVFLLKTKNRSNEFKRKLYRMKVFRKTHTWRFCCCFFVHFAFCALNKHLLGRRRENKKRNEQTFFSGASFLLFDFRRLCWCLCLYTLI